MSSKDDVLQFLDSLDTTTTDASGGSIGDGSGSHERTAPLSGSTAAAGGASTPGGATQQDEQSVLDFLDEITQSASASSPAAGPPSSSSSSTTALPSRYLQQQQQQQQQPQSSWLGSLWSQASEAVKHTQTAVQSSVKATMEGQAAKNLEERVKGFVNAENINKIGNDLRSLTMNGVTTVLDVIAPPIAEHEIVEVRLAHDMVGYVGMEAIVYKSFSKVMEQTEGGDVVVHLGAGTSQNDDVAPENRQLNACEGYEQAVKLAKANIEHLIKSHYNPETPEGGSSGAEGAKTPNAHTSRCPVFMAIQPCRIPRHGYSQPSEAEPSKIAEKDMFVSFVLVLHDPTHKLEFESCSQSMPAQWLLIPYEENEWVEDRMVDCIRLAVGVVAQDYVWTRMKGDELQRLQIQEAKALAQQQQQQQQEQQAGTDVKPPTN
ncbi:hypothetical protein B0O80DRAFT_233193 [Mortierella sp. GBAus27b]|nr:hypothetical protein BGX31_009561 [Mortierella sp. GBA43]KAI8359536.1 hypothetical protein B0O80DRAFT_233193 [Mortierella sp. GBAus27b]